jgi:beta-galactosidase
VYYSIVGDLDKVSMENGNPIDPTSRTKADYRSMFFGKTRLFLEEGQNAKEASVIVGSILGDKALYASNEISIDVQTVSLIGNGGSNDFEVLYTLNGENPETYGVVYTKPFKVTDAAIIYAIVKQNGAIVLTMEETFGENEGLFWGDENSAHMWIGRGVNISAEDGALIGSATKSNKAHRYKGSGFVDFKGGEGSITWYQENDGEPGDYSIRFRYMHNNEGKLHPMKLFVNDVYIRTLEFKPTGGWEKDWKFVPTIITLKAGANNIKLETAGEGGPFIDEMFVD